MPKQWANSPCSQPSKNEFLLKEIADRCDINKPLTFHIARYTFATTVTLNYGVPLEPASKMLGHSNIRQTQHCAKQNDRRFNDDMLQLKRKRLINTE